MSGTFAVRTLLAGMMPLAVASCVFSASSETGSGTGCDDPLALSASCSKASASPSPSASALASTTSSTSTSTSSSSSTSSSTSSGSATSTSSSTAAAPTVTSISPVFGPASGGTTVTIAGTGFASGASASVGGSACSSLAVVSSTTLTCVTPAGTAATIVSVTVSGSDGQSASLASSFTYYGALSISPTSRTLAVSNSVTFNGTGGYSSYSYSVLSGGGTVTQSTGIFAAATSTGTSIVRLSDSAGQVSDATVTVNAALAISPTSKTLAVGNSVTFSTSGGVPSITFSVASGSGTVNSSTGLYTAPGSSGSATLRATDAYGNSADATVTINPALSVSPSSVTLTTNSTQSFTASGGVGSATFSVAGTGWIHPTSGLYQGPYLSSAVTITATDTVGNSTSVTITSVAVDKVYGSRGGQTNCAILSDGRAKCWGLGSSGVLGLGDNIPRGDAPAELGASLPYLNLGTNRSAIHIEGAFYCRCAITDIGTVKCWGMGQAGCTGHGNTTNIGANDLSGATNYEMGDNLAVTDLGSNRTVTEIAGAKNEGFCAILDTGAVKCWGKNSSGQGGVGNTTQYGDGAGEMGDSLQAVSLGTGRTARKISRGPTSACAILDTLQLKCWGGNTAGELGLGDTIARGDDSTSEMGDSLPVTNLGTNRTVTSIASASFLEAHCAILDTGAVKCWGTNSNTVNGQATTLGDATGEMGDCLSALNLGSGRTTIAISAGWSHFCALLDNGTLKCWGTNSDGQLGNGGGSGQFTAADATAVNVGTNRTVIRVSASEKGTCVNLDNGKIRCWGLNTYGEQGVGDNVTRGTSVGHMGDSLSDVSL